MPRPIALALVPLLLTGCLERTQPTVANDPRPVQVVRVALAPATEARRYVGVTKPRREADLAFRVGGRITERSVDLGAHVAAGTVLARLDPIDLGLAVQSAEADLAAAEAQEAQAGAEAQRSRALVALGHVTASADDTAQANARSGRQKVIAARAAVTLARNRLDYAVLRAPADGVVTAVIADPGTVVAEGAPVLRLATAATPEIEINLPEAALPTLERATATASFWAQPDTLLPVHMREVAAQADGKLRTYAVRFTIADPPPWIALGMTATVKLDLPGDTPVATLPAAAIADRGAGPMVWTVNAQSGRLTAQTIDLRVLRQSTAVVAGLSEGQLVVSLGTQKLDPAALVRVAETVPLPPTDAGQPAARE